MERKLMNDRLDMNEDYGIRERYVVGEVGFVLGERDSEIDPYVTWCFRADNPSEYFWGHYSNSRQNAYDDYLHRIENEAVAVFERTGEKPLLPPMCLTVLKGNGNLVTIQRGVTGFYPSTYDSGNAQKNREIADHTNERLKVSKAQEQAMFAGSMFGWHVKAADPRNYNENGTPKRASKKKNQQER